MRRQLRPTAAAAWCLTWQLYPTVRSGVGAWSPRRSAVQFSRQGTGACAPTRAGPARFGRAHTVAVAAGNPAPHDDPMPLTLRSPAFEPGTAIPACFDHDRGDVRRRRPLLESLHRLPPDLLPASSALGGQPAALRIPHAPCIPPETAASA